VPQERKRGGGKKKMLPTDDSHHQPPFADKLPGFPGIFPGCRRSINQKEVPNGV